MQDKDKILEIRDLLNSILAANDLYSDENKGFYFAYDSVIELLQQVNETIDVSARCPRPENITSDIPWCENMNNEFDPLVYKGDMSVEDFSKAQDKYYEDNEDDKTEDEDEEYEV